MSEVEVYIASEHEPQRDLSPEARAHVIAEAVDSHEFRSDEFSLTARVNGALTDARMRTLDDTEREMVKTAHVRRR